MGRTTATPPTADVQRHPVPERAADRAKLGRGKPAVHDHQVPSIPGGLVLQHAAELSPRDVADRAGQAAVLDHIPHGQVLDHERLVLTHESSAQFVQMVPTPSCDLRVHTGHPEAGLVSIVGTWGLTGQGTLCGCQTLPVPPLVSGIGDLFPRGQGQQVVQADVDAHRGAGSGQWPDVGVLTERRHEPAPCAVSGHCHRARRHPLRKRSGPHNGQGLAHLGQGQLAIVEPERGSGVLRRGAGLLLGLESRILPTLGEEVCEGGLQVARSLLERNRGDITQMGQPLGFLPRGQQRRGGVVRDPFLPQRLRLGASSQGEVVDRAHASERAGQLGRLRVSWMEAVLERPLHVRGHGKQPTASADEPPRAVCGMWTVIRAGDGPLLPVWLRSGQFRLQADADGLQGGSL
ncbi:hypothetical protein BCF44_10654 [Kutzneria buriramensis]|uniref:Uncharacterized protein n=1 Tax=Kutzneria buriramensis TaxID=1045776 RepID=A0A3E0HKM1_9PSEU|nr:hypothetical protein BCF44_10654 [Kutzneria buriramensis]